MSSYLASEHVDEIFSPSSAARSLLAQVSPSMTRQEFFDLLDTRLKDLSRETQALQTYRNSMSRPNSLPIEILSSIFLVLQGVLYERLFATKKTMSWVRCMLVCRHWRKIMVNCAALWSDISIDSIGDSRFMALMIERSKGAPLTLSADGLRPEFCDALRDALSNSQRLQSVKIVIREDQGADVEFFTALADMAKGANMLQELVVRDNRSESGSSTLPPQFTLEGMPSLKVLELTDVDFQWRTMSPPASLTTLQLRCRSTDSTCVELELLLQSLNGLQYLQNLELRELIQPIGPPSLPTNKIGPAHPNLNLPLLIMLKVEDRAHSVEILLSSIRIPKQALVWIALSDDEVDEDQIDRCFTNVNAAWGNSSDDTPGASTGVMSLVVDEACSEGAMLDEGSVFSIAFHDRPVDDRGQWPHNSHFEVETRTQHFSTSSGLISSSNKHFNLATLETLNLHHRSVLSSSVIERVFGPLSNLHKMVFMGASFHEFLLVLKRDPAIGSPVLADGSRAIPLFPALETIELIGLRCWRFVDGHLYDACTMLIESMRARAEQYRIKYLTNYFVQNFDASDDAAIRESLPWLNYSWDGSEGT